MPEFKIPDTPVSPIKAGLGCFCPRCSKGKLYSGFLDFADNCSECGLDYSEFEKGDGPAVFIILIMGFITDGFALVVEVNYQPPPLASCFTLGANDYRWINCYAKTYERDYDSHAIYL